MAFNNAFSVIAIGTNETFQFGDIDKGEAMSSSTVGISVIVDSFTDMSAWETSTLYASGLWTFGVKMGIAWSKA